MTVCSNREEEEKVRVGEEEKKKSDVMSGCKDKKMTKKNNLGALCFQFCH